MATKLEGGGGGGFKALVVGPFVHFKAYVYIWIGPDFANELQKMGSNPIAAPP